MEPSSIGHTFAARKTMIVALARKLLNQDNTLIVVIDRLAT